MFHCWPVSFSSLPFGKYPRHIFIAFYTHVLDDSIPRVGFFSYLSLLLWLHNTISILYVEHVDLFWDEIILGKWTMGKFHKFIAWVRKIHTLRKQKHRKQKIIDIRDTKEWIGPLCHIEYSPWYCSDGKTSKLFCVWCHE